MNLEDILDQIRRAQLLGVEPPALEDIVAGIEASLDDDGCPECEAREDEEAEASAAMDRLYNVAGKADSDYAATLDALHGVMKATCSTAYDIRDAGDLFAFIGQTYADHIESIKGGTK